MSTTSLCRVCVKEVKELVHLLNLYYDDTEACLFIKDILHIEVEEDTRTLVICNTCNHVLNNFHQFYKMVKRAQEKYEEMKTIINPTMTKVQLFPVKVEIDHSSEYCNDNDYKPGDCSNTKCENDSVKEDCELRVKTEKSKTELRIKKPKKKDMFRTESNSKKLGEKNVNKESEKALNITESNLKKIQVRKSKHTRWREATNVVLSKYKMEELCRDGEWLLSEDEIDWVLRLFVDMKCVRCEYAVDRYGLLQEHCIGQHGKDPSLECCGFTAPHFASIQSHILHTHILQHAVPWKSRLILCPECGKSVRLTTLKDHMSSHLPHSERNYQCDICQEGFSMKSKLIVHMMSLHSTTKLPCDQCDKEFKSKRTLRMHVRRFHSTSDGAYLCPHCGKKLKSKISFTNHINIHEGVDDRVKCALCDTVVKQMNLKKHMRSHDPKNYKQCALCEYKGLKLKEHFMAVHEKIKAHACSHCTMTFQNRVRMLDHEASRHTGIPRYTCEYCDKTFMFDGKYRKHCKLMHPIQYAEKKLADAMKKNIARSPEH